MRKYELMVIINPTLEEKKRKELIDKISEWVKTEKGKIESIDDWGKKLLAYPIKKHQEGYYHLLNLELPNQGARNLDRKVKLNEEIIRYLMVRKD